MGNRTKKWKECFACNSLSPSWISVYRARKGETFAVTPTDCVSLLCVLEGRIRACSNLREKAQDCVTGSVILVPTGDHCECRALTENALSICFVFNPLTLNCVQHFLNRLEPYVGQARGSVCPAPLPLHRKLLDILLPVPALLTGFHYCPHYYDLKVEELFVYFNELYTREQLVRLFAPLLGGKQGFKYLVLNNFRKTDRVPELAEMLGYTVVTFTRRFTEAFGESPAHWLRERRKESILQDIRLTSATFTELAFKYGFSSSAYFTAFCRRNWNATPTELRQKRSSDT